MKFKVGDYVRGISGSGFAITNERMIKGVIVEIRTTSFDIKVLKHESNNDWFINEVFTIDNKWADYFVKINNDVSRVNIEPKKVVNKIRKVVVEETKVAKLIRIDGVTIAIPVDTPIGVSRIHQDDKYIKEIGDSLAIGRLIMTYEK